MKKKRGRKAKVASIHRKLDAQAAKLERAFVSGVLSGKEYLKKVDVTRRRKARVY